VKREVTDQEHYENYRAEKLTASMRSSLPISNGSMPLQVLSWKAWVVSPILQVLSWFASLPLPDEKIHVQSRNNDRQHEVIPTHIRREYTLTYIELIYHPFFYQMRSHHKIMGHIEGSYFEWKCSSMYSTVRTVLAAPQSIYMYCILQYMYSIYSAGPFSPTILHIIREGQFSGAERNLSLCRKGGI
jgi:hypothetical protein